MNYEEEIAEYLLDIYRISELEVIGRKKTYDIVVCFNYFDIRLDYSYDNRVSLEWNLKRIKILLDVLIEKEFKRMIYKIK